MARGTGTRRTPGAKRILEALGILKELNVPKEQHNERSALTLLALLGMTPRKRWSEAKDPMLGITEMMNVFRERFGRQYAPNTRETVRRFTVHQFVQMGLVVANPDDPRRPVNSPNNCYQVAPTLLKLVRTYGTPAWTDNLKEFLRIAEGLRRRRPCDCGYSEEAVGDPLATGYERRRVPRYHPGVAQAEVGSIEKGGLTRDRLGLIEAPSRQ